MRPPFFSFLKLTSLLSQCLVPWATQSMCLSIRRARSGVKHTHSSACWHLAKLQFGCMMNQRTAASSPHQDQPTLASVLFSLRELQRVPVGTYLLLLYTMLLEFSDAFYIASILHAEFCDKDEILIAYGSPIKPVFQRVVRIWSVYYVFW